MEIEKIQLEDMSNEVLFYIVEKMPIKTMGHMTCVNKKFHALVCENLNMISNYVVQNYEECTDTLMICARHYDRSPFAQNLFDKIYEKEKNNETRIKAIKGLRYTLCSRKTRKEWLLAHQGKTIYCNIDHHISGLIKKYNFQAIKLMLSNPDNHFNKPQNGQGYTFEALVNLLSIDDKLLPIDDKRDHIINLLSLCRQAGFDLNYQDKILYRNYSLLMKACEHGLVEIVTWLMEHTVDVNALTNSNEIALDFVDHNSENGKKIIFLLRKAGITRRNQLIKSVSKYGSVAVPLFMIIVSGSCLSYFYSKNQ